MCEIHATEYAHAIKKLQEQRPKKSTIWTKLTRRVDNDATENLSMRRAYKGLKGLMTGDYLHEFTLNQGTDNQLGHSKPAPLEQTEAPRRRQLWQPLKRIWQKNSKRTNKGRLLYRKISQYSQKSNGRGRMEMAPRVTIAEEEDDPRCSEESKPTESQTSLLPQNFELFTGPSELPQSDLFVRTRSPAALSMTATVGESSPVKRQGIHKELPKLSVSPSVDHSTPVPMRDQVESPSTITTSDAVLRAVLSPPLNPPQKPTFVEIEPLLQEQRAVSSDMPIVARHEATRTLPESSPRANYHQDSVSSSVSSIQPPAVQHRVTPSERAEYDRIVRVFFRQHATRIPIPTAWRSNTSRVYLFRGPSSPYRNVVTAPVTSSSSSTTALSANTIFATEPSRRTPSPRTSTTTPEAVSTLRDIVARHAMRFSTGFTESSSEQEAHNTTVPESDYESARPGSALNPAELTGSAVPSPPLPARNPGRRLAISLPVPRGSFESEFWTGEPRKRRRLPEDDSEIAVPRPQTAIPVRQGVNTHAGRSRFSRTIPQDRVSDLLAVGRSVTHEPSRIPQFCGPSRARLLQPVVVDEGVTSSAESEGPVLTPAMSREEEISRRIANIKRKPSVARRPLTPGDDRASIMSGDEVWYEASHVAVVDESVQ
ncbi:hypothetical protein HBH70_059330 [Parastagonospora nodorum]|nr:hypothetical protein HBH43_071700 [Parastagonospora nodorum]KAH4413926.1 hypothetical protein HBH92_082010 [Parastagonospora nodorum]KAH4437380.1 hypothetical protein HBH93_097540 [Parastagonospora nodorum]KAH4450903.1 hypothetical protein HBH91_116920 [Parastagonospora nodorum]KAH4507502.1 hypothetical protein HBH89_074370 [Parastagonospora nodorum]